MYKYFIILLALSLTLNAVQDPLERKQVIGQLVLAIFEKTAQIKTIERELFQNDIIQKLLDSRAGTIGNAFVQGTCLGAGIFWTFAQSGKLLHKLKTKFSTPDTKATIVSYCDKAIRESQKVGMYAGLGWLAYMQAELSCIRKRALQTAPLEAEINALSQQLIKLLSSR